MLEALDLLLVLGLTLRLIRLALVDHLGEWFIQDPARRWAGPGHPIRSKLQAGLDCPFCLGFWIGCGVLYSLYLVGGPGDAAILWRYIAGAFTLNYVAAHLTARVD